jgi:hypothetical protein
MGHFSKMDIKKCPFLDFHLLLCKIEKKQKIVTDQSQKLLNTIIFFVTVKKMDMGAEYLDTSKKVPKNVHFYHLLFCMMYMIIN